ncbi:hypothetical protein AKJ51_03940 [candidate division MSBL1 archaeon SCGC-AAA382A20]|uniref:Uncharacterized protein n=1 Tax=candidate division MSBL1 archaeon SCGC-AAA382A20 TaxID=1698280 RepID=A0A133VIL4_9EURY|nr:hypothetical protein AKJ51_03940 [candidate division MSBL1 archaeon SCGC-AAA382A20]
MRIQPGEMFGGQVCFNVFTSCKGPTLNDCASVCCPSLLFKTSIPFIELSLGRNPVESGGTVGVGVEETQPVTYLLEWDDVSKTWYEESYSTRNRPEKSGREVRRWK